MKKQLAHTSAKEIEGPLPPCVAGAIEGFKMEMFSAGAGKRLAASLIELLELERVKTEDLPVPSKVSLFYRSGNSQEIVTYCSTKPLGFVQLIKFNGGKVDNITIYLGNNQPIAARIEHISDEEYTQTEYTFK